MEGGRSQKAEQLYVGFHAELWSVWWDLPGAKILFPPCKKGQRYVRLRSLLLRSGVGCPNCGLNNINNNNNFRLQQSNNSICKCCSVAFIRIVQQTWVSFDTLWKKGGNIVLFWVAVRVVKCLHIFTNHFVSEGGQRGDKKFLPVTQSVIPFSLTNIFICCI